MTSLRNLIDQCDLPLPLTVQSSNHHLYPRFTIIQDHGEYCDVLYPDSGRSGKVLTFCESTNDYEVVS